jgi:hypothetical protein
MNAIWSALVGLAGWVIMIATGREIWKKHRRRQP